MAVLAKDKIKAANKIRDDIDSYRSKGKTGSAVSHVAEKYNIERSTAQNYIKLLELSGGAQQYVSSGELAMRNALAILKAPKSQQDDLARIAVNSKLNREQITSRILATAKPLEDLVVSKKTKEETDPNIKKLLEGMSEDLGTPVKIENTSDETGVILVETYFTEVFTMVLYNTSAGELSKARCRVDASIDARKQDQQRGIIKFYFDNMTQKKLALIHIRKAAIAYKKS